MCGCIRHAPPARLTPAATAGCSRTWGARASAHAEPSYQPGTSAWLEPRHAATATIGTTRRSAQASRHWQRIGHQLRSPPPRNTTDRRRPTSRSQQLDQQRRNRAGDPASHRGTSPSRVKLIIPAAPDTPRHRAHRHTPAAPPAHHDEFPICASDRPVMNEPAPSSADASSCAVDDFGRRRQYSRACAPRYRRPAQQAPAMAASTRPARADTGSGALPDAARQPA